MDGHLAVWIQDSSVNEDKGIFHCHVGDCSRDKINNSDSFFPSGNLALSNGITAFSHELKVKYLEGFYSSPTVLDNSSSLGDPAIWGDRITWVDQRHGNPEIYIYDIIPGGVPGRETRLTFNSTADRYQPAIHGNRIVWLDQRNATDPNNFDVYLFDLDTGLERRITSSPANRRMPAVLGHQVAWMEVRDGQYDVYLYDLKAGTGSWAISTPGNRTYPSFSHDTMLWLGNGGQILFYVGDGIWG